MTGCGYELNSEILVGYGPLMCMLPHSDKSTFVVCSFICLFHMLMHMLISYAYGVEHLLRSEEHRTSTRRGKGGEPERSARADDKETSSSGASNTQLDCSGWIWLVLKSWAQEARRATRTSRVPAITTFRPSAIFSHVE